MKKSNLFLASLLSLGIVTLSSCSSDNTLLILNWGEYINDDVVAEFEQEYNCEVVISIADSNEKFYSKVKAGTTAYDLVVPSDYMVQKMADQNMLQELDLSKISNYDRNNFMPGVNGIIDAMNVDKDYSNYFVPYFFGTFGLMYNKNCAECEDLEEKVKTYGWQGYFDTDIIPDSVKVGMYNVPRNSYAAAMFYNHLSPNEYNSDLLSLAKTTLSKRKFKEWGTDTLKRGVQAGNLDLAFVYTGDFLDMLYGVCETPEDLESLSFDIYVPEETIAFMDTLVMPKNARHVDLAYKFMDFMLRKDSCYNNASVVGYCTPLKSAYEEIIAGKNTDDPWLQVWSKANETYYPLAKPEDEVQYKGTPLTYFSKDQLTSLTNMINNIKVA